MTDCPQAPASPHGSRRPARSCRRIPILLLGLLLAGGGSSLAQERTGADTSDVERARALTEEGSFGAAADLLSDYLEAHPGQARVRWLYARTLYWSGRAGRAREQYERTLSALPGLGELRVDYGRFLLETGHPREAREVLTPTVSGEGSRAEARRLLARAARATAPRITLSGRYRTDDQPLRNPGLILEAGVPLTPRVDVLLRGSGRALSPGTGEWRRVGGGRLAVDVDWPGPAETSAAAGRLHHTGGNRSGWIGEASVSLDLGGDVTISGSGERWNYRHTRTSLDTALFVETASAHLRRHHPTGWGGEIGGRIDRFPRGNRIRSAHLWILAPVWSEGDDAVRLGYAARAADADRSTFRPSERRPGPPRGPPAAERGGTYTPYYTPERAISHSAVAAALVQPSSSLLLALDGSVGVHATEREPSADVAGAGTGVRFVRRDYRPWRLRGRLRAETSASDALELEAGYREDAFFRVIDASLEWIHWFTGAVPGR